MKADELDELLWHAAAHGEHVVHTPPDGWELVKAQDGPPPLFPGALWDPVTMTWRKP
jgi:hypothetical protein